MFDVKLKEHWLTEKAKSQGIDEHILELSLRHSRTQRENIHEVTSCTLGQAIACGIIWDSTPEGHEFWQEINSEHRVRPEISNSLASMTANVWYIDFREFE